MNHRRLIALLALVSLFTCVLGVHATVYNFGVVCSQATPTALATPTLAQQETCVNGGSTTMACTPITVAAGSTLCMEWTDATSSFTSTIADNNGGTWALKTKVGTNVTSY